MDLFSRLRTRVVDGVPGLVLVVAQDVESSEVLMAAYADREAVEKTVESGRAHYYSTSRKRVWMKGEESGNVQLVKEILVDCDMDALVYKVEPAGGACHMGYGSCFYRRVSGDELEVVGERVFDPHEVYGKEG